jgi:hypothetical protein
MDRGRLVRQGEVFAHGHECHCELGCPNLKPEERGSVTRTLPAVSFYVNPREARP